MMNREALDIKTSAAVLALDKCIFARLLVAFRGLLLVIRVWWVVDKSSLPAFFTGRPGR